MRCARARPVSLPLSASLRRASRPRSLPPLTVRWSLLCFPIACSAEGGVGRLWAGLFPRGLRIVCATLILSNLREKVTEVFEGGLGVEGGAQAAAGGAVEEGAGSAAAAARSRAGAQRAAAQL